MESKDIFKRPSEFQKRIETIQEAYVNREEWPRKWFTSRWPHITNVDKELLNLPLVVRRTVQRWEENHSHPFPWHHWREIRSSRNLHSSQVLTLTLFGSFAGNRLALLGQALLSAGLLKSGEILLESDFEYEPYDFFHEATRARTNIDYVLLVGNSGKDIRRIYCEVKFMETNFGQCSKRSRGLCNGLPQATIEEIVDRCPLTKQGIRYWDLLTELLKPSAKRLGCPVEGPIYQLARNLLHLIREDGRGLIVFSDSRASYIDEETARFIDLLAPAYRHFVWHIHFQQLIQYIGQADQSTAVLLANKYGIA